MADPEDNTQAVNPCQNARWGKRRRKNIYAEYDESSDQYARVVHLCGSKNITVLPLDSVDKKPIAAKLRGIHHKRGVKYKPGDLVIITTDGNLTEVQGKVPEKDANNICKRFGKAENNKNIVFNNFI